VGAGHLEEASAGGGIGVVDQVAGEHDDVEAPIEAQAGDLGPDRVGSPEPGEHVR